MSRFDCVLVWLDQFCDNFILKYEFAMKEEAFRLNFQFLSRKTCVQKYNFLYFLIFNFILHYFICENNYELNLIMFVYTFEIYWILIYIDSDPRNEHLNWMVRIKF